MIFKQLDEKQLDILKEVCNIGVGHAATALSQLIGSNIILNVPYASIVPIKDVSKIVGGPDNLVAGLYLKILGDARGNIFMIFPRESVMSLIYLLNGKKIENVSTMTEMDSSALKEVGNILASAFLNALSSLTNMVLIPSVPGLAFDMAGAVLDYVLIELCQSGDLALVVETRFRGDSGNMLGHFFLLPDPDSLSIILKAIEKTNK